MAETILIVEDEPEFAGPRRAVDDPAGYRTVTARTGPDALRRFYDERPDLVILDVALPGLDGWQLLERLPRVQPGADPHGHGARLGGRQDPRPQARRGRLHHQAAVVPGAVGPGRGGAAAGRDDRPGTAAAAAAPRPRRRPRRPPGAPPRRRRSPSPRPSSGCSPTSWSTPASSSTHRQVLAAVWGAGYDRDVHLLRMTIRNLRLKLDAGRARASRTSTTEYGLGYRLDAARRRPTPERSSRRAAAAASSAAARSSSVSRWRRSWAEWSTKPVESGAQVLEPGELGVDDRGDGGARRRRRPARAASRRGRTGSRAWPRPRPDPRSARPAGPRRCPRPRRPGRRRCTAAAGRPRRAADGGSDRGRPAPPRSAAEPTFEHRPVQDRRAEDAGRPAVRPRAARRRGGGRTRARAPGPRESRCRARARR